MRLRRLSILNYKNIAQADIEPCPGINCFIGGNGEGKTNVLDAVHFLSMCKSSTTAQDSLALRHGEQCMALQGHYEREDGTPEDISCGIRAQQSPSEGERAGKARKTFARSHKPYRRLADHIGLVPLVMVSPTDSLLIAGGSEERRRFMDLIISQSEPDYLQALMTYNKALAQRNALLKAPEEPDPEMLSLWEAVMGREGELIHLRREAYIQSLAPAFARYYSHIAQGHELTGLAYTSHCQRGPLEDIIRQGRERDRAAGFTLHGIHRDDIEMTLAGYPVKREGSQGQNKTYLVALKLAQFDLLCHTATRTIPILLLDDIFDKLDASRVEQIVRLVAGESFGQIFITDTNREHLDSILARIGRPHRLFAVEAGNVTPL